MADLLERDVPVPTHTQREPATHRRKSPFLSRYRAVARSRRPHRNRCHRRVTNRPRSSPPLICWGPASHRFRSSFQYIGPRQKRSPGQPDWPQYGGFLRRSARSPPPIRSSVPTGVGTLVTHGKAGVCTRIFITVRPDRPVCDQVARDTESHRSRRADGAGVVDAEDPRHCLSHRNWVVDRHEARLEHRGEPDSHDCRGGAVVAGGGQRPVSGFGRCVLETYRLARTAGKFDSPARVVSSTVSVTDCVAATPPVLATVTVTASGSPTVAGVDTDGLSTSNCGSDTTAAVAVVRSSPLVTATSTVGPSVSSTIYSKLTGSLASPANATFVLVTVSASTASVTDRVPASASRFVTSAVTATVFPTVTGSEIDTVSAADAT